MAGVIAHVVVSRFTPPDPRGFEQVAEALSHERQAIEGELSH